MPQMTQQQADQLADQRLALKVAMGNFRNTFFDTLTPDQRDGLRNFCNLLGDEVDHLTNVAIQLSLADLQGSILQLGDITTGVNKAVDHLADLRKVLTVATSLVNLGVAVASGKPSTVLSALQSTVTAIKG